MYRRKRIDPRVIGGFVVGAILLGVAGLIFFGPGGFITETERYVLHFDSSVKGLTNGSPVLFRGVKIGNVKDINVRVRPSDFVFHIPVIIEIEPSRIEADNSELGIIQALRSSVKGGNSLEQLVAKGLRGQLKIDSLVTGRLYINLDMYPNEAVYSVQYPSEYPSIPTISSSLDELTKTFEDLPLRELSERLISTAVGLERLVTSPSLHNGLAKFDQTAIQLNRLLLNLNERLPLLTEEIQLTLQETRQALDSFDRRLEPASIDLKTSLQAFTTMAEQTTTAMQGITRLTDNDSQLQQQLSVTLQELSRTARSIRQLSAEIEHDPQILLRGRSSGGQP